MSKWLWALAFPWLVELGVGCSTKSSPESALDSTPSSVSTIDYDAYEANGRIHLGRETVAIRRTNMGWTIETTFVADRGAAQTADRIAWHGTLVATDGWKPIEAQWRGQMGDLRAIQLQPQADRPESLELIAVNDAGVSRTTPQLSKVDLFLPGEVPGTRSAICRIVSDSAVTRQLFPGVEATVGPRRPLGDSPLEGSLDRVTLTEGVSVAGVKPLEVICQGPDLVISRRNRSWVIAVGYESVARKLGADL